MTPNIKAYIKILLDFIVGLHTNSKNKMAYIKTWAISFFKGEFFKFTLKKLLGSAVAAGPKAWIVKVIASWLYDEIGEPVIELVLRKAEYRYYRLDGKIKIRRLRKAEHGTNEEYDDAMDDLFK